MRKHETVLVVTSLALLLGSGPRLAAQEVFVRGDCNRDLTLDIADAITCLSHLFQHLEIACGDACDANDDGQLDISDPIFVLSHLFGPGLPPAPPFPESGFDPTPDDLTCGTGGPAETKPPEAVIAFDPRARRIAVFGIDNADPEPATGGAAGTGRKGRETIRIQDRSGNSLAVDVDLTAGTAGSAWVEAEVLGIRYQGGDTIEPPANRYHARYEVNVQSGELTSLETELSVAGVFSASTAWSATAGVTEVDLVVEGREASYSFGGMYILQMATDNGALSLATARRRAADGDLDWNAVMGRALGRRKAYPPPDFFDTSEFMSGTVAVDVILMESQGASSTEDWTPAQVAAVQNQIQAALDWWAGRHPMGNLSFQIDWTRLNTPLGTQYEPIARASTDDYLWITEAMNALGHTASANYIVNVRDYANTLRRNRGTDWAFVIFVVNSANDADGSFTDGWNGYAPFLGGPYVVLTYDNGQWGINRMRNVAAHETGHIFYACDEYTTNPLHTASTMTGYLNVQNRNYGVVHNCIMNNNRFQVCAAVADQIGWRDQDGDGLIDILDTAPAAVLTPYDPDPAAGPFVTYTGSAAVNPLPNANPMDPGSAATINTIAGVEFRVDGGAWIAGGVPADGAFDDPVESFSFTLFLSGGGATHTIEARAVNSVGNAGAPAADTLTVSDGWHGDYRLTFSSPPVSTTMQNWLGDLAIDGSVIHIAWTEILFTAAAGGQYNQFVVKYQRSTDGGTTWDDGLGNAGWSRALASYSHANMVSRPRIATDGGLVHVVWTVDSVTGSDLYYAGASGQGHTWGFRRLVHVDTGLENLGRVDMAAGGNDVWVVFFERVLVDPNPPVAYEDTLRFLRSTDAGRSWPAVGAALTAPAMRGGMANVIAAGNSLHVVWDDQRTGIENRQVYARSSLDRGASWGPEVRLSSSAADSHGPLVAASGTDVHVVWVDLRDGDQELYWRRSPDGGAAWSAETRLTHAPGRERLGSIAVSGSSVHIAWFAERTPAVNALGLHYLSSPDNGDTWAPDAAVKTYPTASPAGAVQVGATPGRVHLIWEDGRHPNATEIYHGYF